MAKNDRAPWSCVATAVARAVLLSLLVAYGLPAASPRARADEGAPSQTAPFILSAHTGDVVTDQSFSGYFRLMFFGYTHCPDVCPTTLLSVAQVMDQLGAEGARVKPLFVTLDPERDTQATLAKFVGYFHPAIIGLTGPRAMIERVAQVFRIKFERIEDAGGDKSFYTIDHTASLLLIGPSGERISRFPPETPPAEIARRIREALATVPLPARRR